MQPALLGTVEDDNGIAYQREEQRAARALQSPALPRDRPGRDGGTGRLRKILQERLRTDVLQILRNLRAIRRREIIAARRVLLPGRTGVAACTRLRRQLEPAQELARLAPSGGERRIDVEDASERHGCPLPRRKGAPVEGTMLVYTACRRRGTTDDVTTDRLPELDPLEVGGSPRRHAQNR
jgi:hypothetical protein